MGKAILTCHASKEPFDRKRPTYTSGDVFAARAVSSRLSALLNSNADMSTRLNGKGSMKPSHVFRRRKCLGRICRSRIRDCVSLATVRKPFFALWAGPNGPSGVINTSDPFLIVSISPIAEVAARFLLEPLTVPMPQNLKKAQRYEPSLLALTRPAMGNFLRKARFAIGRKNMESCHAMPTILSGEII